MGRGRVLALDRAVADHLTVAQAHKREMRQLVVEQLVTAPSSDPGGTRTHDPLIKSQLLYQLSYGVMQSLF